MKSINLIGVTGKIGAGKDTVALHLAQYGYQQYAFADPLKEAAAQMFGIPVWEFYDRELKEQIHPFWKITRREILQKFGTECARHVFYDDFWIRRASMHINTITDVKEDPTSLVPLNMIITDVRFENEGDWIRKRGGMVVHVMRPDTDGISVSENYDSSTHASEMGLAPRPEDIIIDNTGSLESFHGKIELLYLKGYI